MIATYPSVKEPAAACNQAGPDAGYDLKMLNKWQRRWVAARAGLHIFLLALKTYVSLKIAVKVLTELYLYKNNNLTLGETSRKMSSWRRRSCIPNPDTTFRALKFSIATIN